MKNVTLPLVYTIPSTVVSCCKVLGPKLSTTMSATYSHTIDFIEIFVLKKIFWSQRHEIKGGWKRLHKEELQGVSCCSASVIWLIK
jgi:hypothetical protein